MAAADQLEDAYRQLAARLTTQYTVVFESTNPVPDGSYRSLEVEVARPGAHVDAPVGYGATPDLME